MRIIEIILTSFALSMDAFAIAITKGLSLKKLTPKECLTIALYFGIFQFIMPIIGYLLCSNFKHLIVDIDHWIAFILLTSIGAKQLFETLSNDSNINDDISLKEMIPLSIATSIDALAVGITFTFLKNNILISSISIGIITFIISYIGVLIGNKVGTKYEKKSKILGGIILISIGLKILIEHLYIH